MLASRRLMPPKTHVTGTVKIEIVTKANVRTVCSLGRSIRYIPKRMVTFEDDAGAMKIKKTLRASFQFERASTQLLAAT